MTQMPQLKRIDGSEYIKSNIIYCKSIDYNEITNKLVHCLLW